MIFRNVEIFQQFFIIKYQKFEKENIKSLRILYFVEMKIS
jgi:hypothetical protein